MKIVLFGGNGWIGKQFIDILKSKGHTVVVPERVLRVDDTTAVKTYLHDIKPTHVVSFIGRTHGEGYKTIDYLELPGKLKENVNDNLFAPLSLALICKDLNIHYTYMGTGCIFSETDVASTRFDEEALPNFFGSSYSVVKGFTDRLMHLVPEALNVRIRMPIVQENHPRNFITKICAYDKICSIPNSMSVLPTLLPLLEDMMVKRHNGTINLVNPGLISHNEILEMYKEYVDPDFTWNNFTVEEQNSILLAQRSNNQLDTSKLHSMYPDVPHIRTAVETCFRNWKLTLDGHKCAVITGGCGAIGAEVLNYLKAKYNGTRFVNIDALTYCGREEHIVPPYTNYKFVHGDICDKDLLKTTFETETPTLLIHLAAETHVDQSFGNSFKFTQTNVIGTHTLMEMARLYGGFTQILNMSTDEVYGAVGNDDSPSQENSVFAPSNPYAASKASAELLCHSYIKSFNLPIVIMRCNNAISKYQDPEKLIPKVIKCVREGVKIPVHGKGISKRTFIHGKDIGKAIENIVENGVVGEIYNIGTDMEYSVLEVIQNILNIMTPDQSDIQSWIEYVEDRPFQDYRYSINTTKLRGLGWSESITFEEALHDVIYHNE
jgi:3,5-epimerase/4-reductase